MSFQGVNFPYQSVTPSDDGRLYAAIFPSGVLYGCAVTYSGSTLTVAAGHLMIAGRQIKLTSAENWSVNEATSGYARLKITIDTTQTSTVQQFSQVSAAIEYSATRDGFASLTQQDINGAGSTWEEILCVVSLGTGGITAVVSTLETITHFLPQTGGIISGDLIVTSTTSLQGAVLLGSSGYGDTLPAAGVAGRIFFLAVQ